ncbi:MAG: hypothetical protein FWF54_00325 [Candidatus Azobacteroides sp.]|nr:hypothetical protein [Candidatus Azobacteroides sp.]
MGFFDRIRKGRLFFGKPGNPSMVVEFLFRGKKYILEEFDLEFRQDVNDKNKPDSEVYGGMITLTISETPDEWINAWVMNTYEKQDGEFRFLVNGPKIVESAAMHISFKEAYCISCRKVMTPKGAGLLTTLIISPRKLKIGGEEYESRWKN